MDELFRIFIIFGLPIATIIIAITMGIKMVVRSKETKNFTKQFIGNTFLITALLSIIGLLWLTYEYNQTYSWGKLIIVLAPIIPISIVGIGTILAWSSLTIWNNFGKNNSSQENVVTKYNKIKLWGSGAILSSSIIIALYYILPHIHALPYYNHFFTTHSYYTDDDKFIKLVGQNISDDNRIEIITIKGTLPKHSFHPDLDWRGRVRFRGGYGEPFIFIPFEKSTYKFENGNLIRIENN